MAINEEVPDFLNISVVAANGLKNTALLGKQDVYVSATYGPYTLKTSTVKNGGTMPLWPGGPDTFNFVMDGSPQVHLQVWVPHKTKDDVELGAATLQEAAWAGLQRGAPPREMLLPLYKDGKPAGTLKTFMGITYGPPGHAPQRPQYGAPVVGIPANGAPQQQPYGQHPPYAGTPYGAAPTPYQEMPAQPQQTPYSEHAAAAAAQGQAQQGPYNPAGPYTQNPFAPQQQGPSTYGGVAQQPGSYTPQQQPGYPPQQQPPYGQPGPYGTPQYPPPGGMPVVYGNQPGYPQQQYQRPARAGMGTGGMLMAGGAGLAGGMLIGSALAHDSYGYGDGYGYAGDSNISNSDMGGGDMGGGDMGGGDMGGGGE